MLDKKVAILVGPKFHDEETTIPLNAIKEKGSQALLVGLSDEELTGKYGRVKLTPDLVIDDVSALDFDAIIIPGGGAPERIRLDERALQFIRDFWKTGRPVGAICHGPQVLISAGVLAGIELTCYKGIRDDVKCAGANYVDRSVCIDGQLITSRTPDDLDDFMHVFLQSLTQGFLNKKESEMNALESLELAINREKGAFEFYKAVIDHVQSESVKNKFKYLASTEDEHFEQLFKLYQKITNGKTPHLEDNESEIGRHRVHSSITSDEAIKLAMHAEQKAYDFYRSAALKTKSSRAREMFEYLAAEEIEHKRLLSIDKASSQKRESHFQWATYWDIPPGMDDLW